MHPSLRVLALVTGVTAVAACGGAKGDDPATTPATTTTSTPSSDTGPLDSGPTDSGTVPLTVTHEASGDPHIARIELTPGVPGPTAVSCSAGGDEQLLWEFAATGDDAELIGLLEDTVYDCTLVDLTTDDRAHFTVDTPDGIAPTTTVTTHSSLTTAGPPFLMVNTNDQCGWDITPTLRIYDIDGRARWSHRMPTEVNLAIEARYHGDGQVVWGGGYHPDHALQYLHLDHSIAETLGQELAPDATMFHHDGKLLDDGTELILAETPNTDGAATWLGWRAIGIGGSWTGQLDSQTLFDAGLLPAGIDGDDAYHANWIDLVDDVLYVSQCFTDEILALDPTTGDQHWRIGPGPGSLQLVDSSGSPLPADALPMCQHGLEVRGDQVLIYDNGRYPDRDFSRAMGLRVDPGAGTATLEWSYSEPDWFENAMGDIDDLGDGRVLVHMAHVECWGLFSDQTTTIELDTATQEVVWRMVFDSPDVASYRAERVDTCDAMPHVRYCDGVADRLDALGL